MHHRLRFFFFLLFPVFLAFPLYFGFCFSVVFWVCFVVWLGFLGVSSGFWVLLGVVGVCWGLLLFFGLWVLGVVGTFWVFGCCGCSLGVLGVCWGVLLFWGLCFGFVRALCILPIYVGAPYTFLIFLIKLHLIKKKRRKRRLVSLWIIFFFTATWLLLCGVISLVVSGCIGLCPDGFSICLLVGGPVEGRGVLWCGK
jgi:hypothetical protein